MGDFRLGRFATAVESAGEFFGMVDDPFALVRMQLPVIPIRIRPGSHGAGVAACGQTNGRPA